MRSWALILIGLAACASTSAPPPSDAGALSRAEGDGAPRATLERFVAAAEAGRWNEAYPLLSARWRGLFTPERLASDYTASGPVGPSAARRVRALLAGGAQLTVRQGKAILAVGEGRAAVLFLEEDGWKVDALE